MCGVAVCAVGLLAIRMGHAADTRGRPAASTRSVATTTTAPSEAKAAPTLGPVDQQLGGYVYAAPTGWAGQAVRNLNLAMMYRSPDKAGVVLMQVKTKAAAPPEMKAKYAQTVMEMIRRDFANRKTEVVEPTRVINDKRFYLKLQEKVKVKGEQADTPKVATQLRLYRVIGADMIELTAITTVEKAADVQAVQRMAEEMMLGVRPEK
jgi:hypothetical protein